ncbi:hypothetical protein F66182_3595 [Fusarium sp. NRRL 66182]|nr:hypothetical protein F66182_3595 [Fusarium sp. NRRL 66182]
MSSPTTNQSHSYSQSYSYSYSYSNNYSNNSSGSTYTGGHGSSSSNGNALNRYVNTADRTEEFYATGRRTGHGAMQAMDKIVAFERSFNRGT